MGLPYVYNPLSRNTIKPEPIQMVLSNERLNEIKRSLEDAISETNRVTNGWAMQVSKAERRKCVITLDNVKSLFNGYMKKMLRHHLKNDIEVTRFLSWNKPSLTMNDDTLQITGVRFLQMRDLDHAFMPYVKCALATINFSSLEAKPEEKKKQIISIDLTSFEKIQNIKF